MVLKIIKTGDGSLVNTHLLSFLINYHKTLKRVLVFDYLNLASFATNPVTKFPAVSEI